MTDIIPHEAGDIQETSSSDSANSKSGVLKVAWQFVSRRLLNFAVIAGFVSIAGFFVVHSYLYKVTGLFTYKIDSTVYAAAGANVVIGTIAKAISWLVPGVALGVVWGTALIVIAIPVVLLYERSSLARRIPGAREIAIKRFFSNLLRIFFNLNNLLIVIILLVTISLIAVSYGYSGYDQSPRFLGGGMPTTIILVFKSPSPSVEELGLPLTMNPDHLLQSAPVELLMELSDGVLVRDPLQGIPMFIKNDSLYAIIDALPKR